MSGKIFINYRREDSKHPAGRLYDRLLTEFAIDQIFIDVDNIAAGADFVDELNDQVSQCHVMLSVIGPHWCNIKDPVSEIRRLDNPDDFVRIEIESALSRNIHIIPVLVDDAMMPSAHCLPASLKPLSRRNAVRLTHERFHVDSIGLVAGIRVAFAKREQETQIQKEHQELQHQVESKRLEAGSLAARERQKNAPKQAKPLGYPSLEQYSGPMPQADCAKEDPSIPRLSPTELPRTANTQKSTMAKRVGSVAALVTLIGFGIGILQYLNQNNLPDALPQGPKKQSLLAKKIPQPKKANKSVTTPVVTPSKDYKIGMSHLVKGEFAQARPFLEKAVAGGHAEAAYNLAALYVKGDGVEQSFEKAVSYLKKSSNGGYFPAMTNLGLLYARGQGVEQNYLTARSFWLKAAAGKHPDAMHNLAVIYATGKGVDKDMGEAIKWYRKAANAGYVDSIANLGLLYANGDGVERDYDEAKRLWEKAAGNGHKTAIENLEKLNKVMAQ